MRYVEARLVEKTNALIYRIYVTDCLQNMVNNVTPVGGIKINMRYYDLYKQAMEPAKQETRTSEEIITHLKDKMRKLRE